MIQTAIFAVLCTVLTVILWKDIRYLMDIIK